MTGITQDEPLHCEGSGGLCPDAEGVGTDAASVRAERDPTGDGRVYHLAFRATDGRGGTCFGTAVVCVPAAPGAGCVDGGPLVDGFCAACFGLCEASGPCLADSCELPADPLDTPTARFNAVRCAFDLEVGSACVDERIPRSIGRRLGKARTRIERASLAATTEKAERLVQRAVSNLAKASQRTLRAERSGKIGSPCANELLLVIERARARAEGWLATL